MAEVAAITERAMAGELDFEQSLRARAALLAGLPESALARVRDRITLTPGARTLCRTLGRLGYRIALVSGGFTEVIAPIAADLGVTDVRANTLEVRDGVLTGNVIGPVIDRLGQAGRAGGVRAAVRHPPAPHHRDRRRCQRRRHAGGRGPRHRVQRARRRHVRRPTPPSTCPTSTPCSS